MGSACSRKLSELVSSMVMRFAGGKPAKSRRILIPDRYLPANPQQGYGHDERRYIMSGFFEELQRRKVYRIAAAYIVAAGFLIQIASAAFPAWELPNWSLRLVIVLLLIGFPIALILAWAYDITPHGIQGTPKTPGVHRRRNLILLIASGVISS